MASTLGFAVFVKPWKELFLPDLSARLAQSANSGKA